MSGDNVRKPESIISANPIRVVPNLLGIHVEVRQGGGLSGLPPYGASISDFRFRVHPCEWVNTTIRVLAELHTFER